MENRIKLCLSILYSKEILKLIDIDLPNKKKHNQLTKIITKRILKNKLKGKRCGQTRLLRCEDLLVAFHPWCRDSNSSMIFIPASLFS